MLGETLVANDSIDSLPLSNRTKNALHKIGIYDTEKLLLLKEEDLRDVRNLGAKSIQETIDLIKKLRGGNEEVFTFRGKDGIKYLDILIDEVNLSVRARNCLRGANYSFASEVINMNMDELLLIKNMGIGTAKEIIQKMDILEFCEVKDLNQQEEKFEQYLQHSIVVLKNKFNRVSVELVYPRLQEFLENHSLNERDFLENPIGIQEIYSSDEVMSMAKEEIMYLLQTEKYGLSSTVLELKLSNAFKKMNLFSQVLEELFKDNKIEYAPNNNIIIKHISILEYIDTLKNGKNKYILENRLRGKTLDEIGKSCDLTRERVRQITKKILKNTPKLREDFFADIFEKYYIDKSNFLFGFREKIETYNYLSNTYCAGKKEIGELITDENFSIYFRKVAEKIVYKNYIRTGEERIKCNRTNIVDYIIKNVTIQPSSRQHPFIGGFVNDMYF